MSKPDKDLIYRLLAEGKTDAEIGKLISRVPSTVAYHRKLWEKAGKPGLQMPDPEPVKPAETETPAQIPVEALPVTAPTTPQTAGPPPTVQAAASKPAVQWNPAPKQRRTLQVGEWYEGAVAVVGDSYVLIDLVELADDTGRSPRGILHQRQAEGQRNPALIYHLEELVKVRVVDKRFNPTKQRLDIDLSTVLADQVSAPAAAPVPRPAPSIPATKLEPRVPVLPQPIQPEEHPQSYRPSPDLCATCVKADVCPITAMIALAIEKADLGYYNSLHIKTRPIEIDQCGAYRAEEVR